MRTHVALAVVVAASTSTAWAVPQVASRARLDPHIMVQDTWFTDANVRPYGVRNDAISISGHWFLQEGTFGGDREDFLAKTQEDVERRLDAFKAAHPEGDPDTDALIVMDIERPGLSDLHMEDPGEQDAIVNAYRIRIAATKAAFPNAKLGVYGTVIPDPQGRSQHETYLERLAALREAREEGLYDDLDFLIPILYVRFGCDDEVNGPCDRRWDTLDEYTQLGIDGSRQLTRSDGSSLPLFPLLTFWVLNGNSLFHDELLMNLGIPDPVEATLGKQLDILAANGVRQLAFWTRTDNNQLGEPSDPTVTDYLCELFRRHCPLGTEATP